MILTSESQEMLTINNQGKIAVNISLYVLVKVNASDRIATTDS